MSDHDFQCVDGHASRRDQWDAPVDPEPCTDTVGRDQIEPSLRK